MTYRSNVFKFLFSTEDHLFRIKKAEKLHNLWKMNSLLLLSAVILYAWMAYLGIGTNFLSNGAVGLTPLEYEQQKFWFLIGRVLYALLIAAFILFIPSLIYYAITGIPYQKLVILQQVVLLVMLLERLIWIPLALFNGLDWYVSPLSLGIIASYLFDHAYPIYFFGAISLFQIWIIWFQVTFIGYLSEIKKRWLWVIIVGLHIFYWALAALLAFADQYIINGWFG
ncbi:MULTISPECIES: hypothetical protein [Virgibacillus]|uniref:Yip1 domain-containing protein n=1 Tax=Virgibacillus massiliensis TaxID=1462526 RepID=A0A024QFS9_9BACI|nr:MULTISPECIES: hypothetical protein [Virgibacillus]EQB34533.1 hypothetical protein M948_20960 [Virgibacillus sp. CM-4]MYL43714.1 hypothetical protein [Virgibacillus massiliensis]CDQ41359.1 hypothetical protein BN990_03728 [Virgibacillus massiliensis]